MCCLKKRWAGWTGWGHESWVGNLFSVFFGREKGREKKRHRRGKDRLGSQKRNQKKKTLTTFGVDRESLFNRDWFRSAKSSGHSSLEGKREKHKRSLLRYSTQLWRAIDLSGAVSGSGRIASLREKEPIASYYLRANYGTFRELKKEKRKGRGEGGKF